MTGKLILLVEDSPTQAVLLQSILESEGLTVQWANSGEAALECIARERPDVIIADCHLPGIQGDELCRQVRMNLSTQDIPIIMLTEDRSMATRLQGLDSGADDYLSKSEDSELVLMRVQTHLARAKSQVSFDFLVNTQLRRAKVLVVDDSPTYSSFLENELMQEGFDVAVADNGKSAFRAVEEVQFDCVIIDVVMPEIDGIQVCKELAERRLREGSDIVLIVVSGDETRENVINAIQAGADEFLTKSSDAVLLRARVRGLLRRKFLREQNRKIIEEFKSKELEAVEARTRQEAAEARAALVEKLEQANTELEETNSELRETQSQLIQSAKMASLGELVAGIAHEVNNPLAFSLSHLGTIGNLLGKIPSNAGEVLNETSSKQLDKIRVRVRDTVEGLERVRELVNKLRTFSRLDEGEYKICDMVENIESTLTLLRYRIPNDVVVKTNFTDHSALYCAPGALNQVVMNIVSNAIDATGDSGTISLSTAREGDQFHITVSDTGLGVPASLKDRIFEPFFTTKDVGSGTGLGLSIAYKIVARHKGSISVDSKEGKGTTFTVSIPTNLQEISDG